MGKYRENNNTLGSNRQIPEVGEEGGGEGVVPHDVNKHYLQKGISYFLWES